jgi:glycosyltransferase involved in cell wall biosynthesis
VCRYSVIVCTRFRPYALARCLASLAEMDYRNPELIVVDNTKGDLETERVTAQTSARYLVEPRVGLSRARNTGIEAATGDLIAFLDDDAVVDPAWLSRHAEVLMDDSLMASTGRILPAASEDGAGSRDLGRQPFTVDRSDPWWFERANFGGLGSGSNMVVKRQAFEHGLRFRETLGLGASIGGGEENQVFFTLIKGGARIAYVPDALVRHHDPELSAASEKLRISRALSYRAAYVTMLLVEEPEYRRRTMRRLVRGFRRQRHPWRQTPPPSRLLLLTAAYRGPLLYIRSRLGNRRRVA